MKRRAALAPAFALIALALASCASVGPSSISTKDIGGPDTHTLAYGYLGYHSIFGKGAAENALFIQLNPEHEAALYYAIRPAGNSGFFFLTPQPVGSSWKLLEFVKRGGNSITYYKRGVAGKNPYDPRMEKPGLYYIGAYAYGRDENPDGAQSDYELWDIHELKDEGYELGSLKALLPNFKRTAWQGLIEARIKELSK